MSGRLRVLLLPFAIGVAMTLTGACHHHTTESAELERLRVQQHELQAHIAKLQATIDALERRLPDAPRAPILVTREKKGDPSGGSVSVRDGKPFLSNHGGPAVDASEVGSSLFGGAAASTSSVLRIQDLHGAPIAGSGTTSSDTSTGEAKELLDQLRTSAEQLKQNQATEQQALDALENMK